MSLYGNIKRIGSQSFQFDHVYPTRKAMDDAISIDEVYPGRYVLVEYGERYTINPSTNERTEREEYAQNRRIDMDEYHNVYDSTVWQKVYTKNANNNYLEKYIMVAELNALAPKLTLIPDQTATLKKEVDDSGEIKLFYGDNNDILHDVSEIVYNSPYFDDIQDTELEYQLHMPKPLELEVNKDIEYHQDKFDIYHTHTYEDEESGTEKGNFIGWKPKPEGNEALKIQNVDDTDTSQGKKITDNVQFSKQELNMYLPAFGDVLGALYDTLFGRAGINGGLRPYFAARGLTENDFDPNSGTITDVTKFSGDADISRILANNSEGLAGILSALFADNTIPGKVRYYLSADWMAKNTNSDTNTPGIVNKPKVVFKNNEDKADSTYNSHYQIDYTNWLLTNILFNIIKNITGKTDSNEHYIDAIESITFSEPDLLTIVADLSQFDSNNKKIDIDIETRFSDTSEITINGNIVTNYYVDIAAGHLICTIDLSKLVNDESAFTIMAPNSEDVNVLIQLQAKNYLLNYISMLMDSDENLLNQSKVYIIKSDKNNYIILGDLNNLEETEIDGQVGKWIGVIAQTRDLNENALKVEENKAESEDSAIKIKEITDGAIKLYLNLNELKHVQYFNESTISNEESSILKSGQISLTFSSNTKTTVEEVEKPTYEEAFINFNYKNIPLIHTIEIYPENSIPSNYNNREELVNNINNSDYDNNNQQIVITANYQNLSQFWKDNEYKSWLPLLIQPYSLSNGTNVSDVDFNLVNAKVDTYLSSNGNIVILTGLEDLINQQNSTLSAVLKDLRESNKYKYASDLQADSSLANENVLNNIITSDFSLQFKGVSVLQNLSKLSTENLPSDPNYPIEAGRNNQGDNINGTQNFEIIYDEENDVYNIFVKTKEGYLAQYESTNNSQGNAYWIGLVVSTNCIKDITTIKWNGTNLNSSDALDAASLNLDEGQVVLWLKAESMGEKNISLTADYYIDSNLNINIQEYPNRTISYNNNGRGMEVNNKPDVNKYNDEPITIDTFFPVAHYLNDLDTYVTNVNEREDTPISGVLTYDLNGGTWSDPDDIVDGEIAWYSSATNYRQDRWDTEEDGSTQIENTSTYKYNPGNQYEDKDDITLYAIWTVNDAVERKPALYSLPYSTVPGQENPEKWEPYMGAQFSSKTATFYPDKDDLTNTLTDGVFIMGHKAFNNWQTEDGVVRTNNVSTNNATESEIIYANYNDTMDKFRTRPASDQSGGQELYLPTVDRTNYVLLGWTDNINSDTILPGFTPGHSVIYEFTDPNKADDLKFYGIWQAYLTFTFNANGKGTNFERRVPPNSDYLLPEYFDDYLEPIEEDLTITIDDSEIDNWELNDESISKEDIGNNGKAFATYVHSQNRYVQNGWEHENDENSPYNNSDHNLYENATTDEEFKANWSVAQLEQIEPYGTSYILPVATPVHIINKPVKTIKYYTDRNTNNDIFEQSINGELKLVFTSWYSATINTIRINNDNVVANETIYPNFTENNAIILSYDNFTLPDLNLGISYRGWETEDGLYIGDKGQIMYYNGSYTKLYAVPEEP